MAKGKQVLVDTKTWAAVKALLVELDAFATRRPLTREIRERVAMVAEKVAAEP